jgi:hypothetical protein
LKRFATEEIKKRLIARLQVHESWASILDEGTISNLFDVIAEGFAENARYMEYLLNESKWDNAQNLTSLTHMAKLIGRKIKRPISSIGYIIVSHSDMEGKNRLQDYNSYYFSLDQASDYDDLIKNESASLVERHALVPWTYSTPYIIPKYTVFKSNSGIEFFATTTVRSRQLKEPYSIIKRNEEKFSDFILEGGWEGIKYLKVPVIQGIQKQTSIGKTKGGRFETFLLDSMTVEDASNSVSSKLFSIVINNERWVEVPSIKLAGPYDKVFETNVRKDNTGIAITFGDSISGLIPPKDSIVWVEYVDTLGSVGNVTTKASITTIAWPPNWIPIDPRTNLQNKFLYCTNIQPIGGGLDSENEETFKENAPSSYLESYTIGNTRAYEKAIKDNSPVGLLKCKLFNRIVTTTEQIATASDDRLQLELTKSANSLNITAIKFDGSKIDNPKITFLEPLTQSLADFKGPTDALNFIEPNFVRLAANVTVKTTDLEVSTKEIKDYVSNSILDAYSIQNQDFSKPLYLSTISERSSCFPFSDSVNVFLEAIANTNYDNVSIYSTGNLDTNFSTNITSSYVVVPFYFDEVYSLTKSKAGFQNYQSRSPYLLRAEIKMPNLQTSRDRMLFLLDSREEGSTLLLEDAKDFSFTGYINPTIKTSITRNSASFIKLYNEREDGYLNRQVRVAQYPYFDTVCTDANMFLIKNPMYSPFEVRPLVVDNTGNKKEFVTSSVDTNLREPIVEGSTLGQNCYKKDLNYYEGFDIIFNENYDKTDETFANGYVVIPMSYLGFGPTLSGILDLNTALDALPILLKDNVSIKVYARPKITDIELDDPEDMAFIEDEDVRVERQNIIV